MGDVSHPTNYSAGSTPAKDAPRDRSWRDRAYTAGTTPLAVYLQLRIDWPDSCNWNKPHTLKAIDQLVAADPAIAEFVDACIADLSPIDDRSEDR